MTPLSADVLAVIPARGGSRGLPRKNVLQFCGRPLIAWTIAAALESGVAGRVIVSTDDEEIAAVAREAGAEVPFLRPAELATDEATTLDVALHLLDTLALQPAWLLLLQPTSPLRTASDICAAAALAGESDAVVSLASASQWLHRVDRDGFLEPLVDVPMTRRQDAPPAYALNGAIYLVRTEALRRERTFCPRRTRAYIMPPERSVDIDTALDWTWAQMLAEDSPCSG